MLTVLPISCPSSSLTQPSPYALNSFQPSSLLYLIYLCIPTAVFQDCQRSQRGKRAAHEPPMGLLTVNKLVRK